MGRTAAVLALAMLLVAPSCTSPSDAGSDAGDGSDPSGSTTVVVLAAASLTDVADDLVDAFSDLEPDLDVVVSTGGSSSLAVSIEEGAPADVFASASDEVMAGLVDQGLVDGEPVEFATNELVIAVPVDGASGDAVTSLADFSRDDLALGACAPQVPCGSYADEALDAAGVVASFDTRDPDVRAVVTKLLAGELDAGIVYATDVAAFPDDLRAVEIPDDVAPTASYPVAVLAESEHPDDARRFVDFLTSETARSILAAAGFGAP